MRFVTGNVRDEEAYEKMLQERFGVATRITRQTEFVSAHAHQENPDEDMAESIASLLIDPDKLKSRPIGKYEVVRYRIIRMHPMPRRW